MVLKGKKINLRKLKAGDSSSLAKHANDRQVGRYLARLPYPYSLTDAKKFIRKSQASWRKGESKYFGIELKETGEIIGMISFTGLDSKTKIGRIGYWVGKKYWRQGIGSEALGLLLGHAFKNLKLQRVEACVYSPNRASHKLLQKYGFKKEGVLRRKVLKKKYLDQIEYGLLKEEYKN